MRFTFVWLFFVVLCCVCWFSSGYVAGIMVVIYVGLYSGLGWGVCCWLGGVCFVIRLSCALTVLGWFARLF